MIQVNEIRTPTNNFSKNNSALNVENSYRKTFFEKLQANENFNEMFQSTLEKYFGQSGQIFYHVFDATSISRENWTHNDFPYEKFLQKNIDESVLTWQPTRNNPSQLNSEVQNKLTATLGKNSIVIPPGLEKKLQTDSKLRQKVLANIKKVFEFHTQPPKIKMPGVKEYGTKIFGSVTILNSEGEVENCVVTSGGTIMGPDEKTLQQFELEQKRKLKRKIYNRELIADAQKNYLLNKNLIFF